MNDSVGDLRSYSRHWVKEFILSYKKESCLWQTSHQDYNNAILRNIAYDKLVNKLKEVETNPDRTMVVKKINSLRSAFRREYRKKVLNNNYASRLWYYDVLSFISDQSSGNKVKNGRKSKVIVKKMYKPEPVDVSESVCDEVLLDLEDNEIDRLNDSDNDNENNMESEHDMTIEMKNIKPHVRLLKISNIENQDDEIQEAVSAIEPRNNHQSPTMYHHQQDIIENQQHPQNSVTHSIQSIQLSKEQLHSLLNTSNNTPSMATVTNFSAKDEFDAIGVNVASKLRCMNANQRIIAEKLISDVLFNAQLDILSVSSKISSD